MDFSVWSGLVSGKGGSNHRCGQSPHGVFVSRFRPRQCSSAGCFVWCNFKPSDQNCLHRKRQKHSHVTSLLVNSSLARRSRNQISQITLRRPTLSIRVCDGLRRFCTRFYVGFGQKNIMGTRVGYNSNTRWDLRGNSRLATIHATDKESLVNGVGWVMRAWTRDYRYTLPQNGERAMRCGTKQSRQGGTQQKSQRTVCFLMTWQ